VDVGVDSSIGGECAGNGEVVVGILDAGVGWSLEKVADVNA
jgi:hypothetical protein